MARDPVKISRNLDDNAVANVIYAGLSDGTDSLAINADGSINATINNASIVVTATDLDIRDLSHTQDSISIGDGTDLLSINNDGSINITDNGGSLTVDGTVAATQSGTWDIGTLTSITNDVNIADGGNSITVDDGGTSLTVDGTVTVTATDLDIRDLSATQDNVAISDGTDTLAVNADGSINVVVAASSGTAVTDYSEAAALATLTSSNHDYTASGGAFEVRRIEVSGESIGTFEILLNGVAKGKIRTSVEEPNAVFNFEDGTTVADTQVVRVVRTNDSNKTHAFNSTIIGYQF